MSFCSHSKRQTACHAFLLALAFVAILPTISKSADTPSKSKSADPADIESALKSAKIGFQKDADGNIAEVTFGSDEASGISTANLKLVGKITTLKTIGSQQSFDNLTNDKLAAIAAIKTIESLKFDCCVFKGGDLKKLISLPKLTTIDWTDSKIDDEGARGIGNLKYLTVLKLKGNQITDAGLKSLSKLKDLEELNLDKTRDDIHFEKAVLISDAGLVSLKPMKKLKILSLRRNAISDAGLKNLTELQSLKELDLANNKVTDAGIAKLQMSLPDCKINIKE